LQALSKSKQLALEKPAATARFDPTAKLSKLMDFQPKRDFNECVARYRGNYRMREFSCRDQFLAMTFAQLSWAITASSG